MKKLDERIKELEILDKGLDIARNHVDYDERYIRKQGATKKEYYEMYDSAFTNTSEYYDELMELRQISKQLEKYWWAK